MVYHLRVAGHNGRGRCCSTDESLRDRRLNGSTESACRSLQWKCCGVNTKKNSLDDSRGSIVQWGFLGIVSSFRTGSLLFRPLDARLDSCFFEGRHDNRNGDLFLSRDLGADHAGFRIGSCTLPVNTFDVAKGLPGHSGGFLVQFRKQHQGQSRGRLFLVRSIRRVHSFGDRS